MGGVHALFPSAFCSRYLRCFSAFLASAFCLAAWLRYPRPLRPAHDTTSISSLQQGYIPSEGCSSRRTNQIGT